MTTIMFQGNKKDMHWLEHLHFVSADNQIFHKMRTTSLLGMNALEEHSSSDTVKSDAVNKFMIQFIIILKNTD